MKKQLINESGLADSHRLEQLVDFLVTEYGENVVKNSIENILRKYEENKDDSMDKLIKELLGT